MLELELLELDDLLEGSSGLERNTARNLFSSSQIQKIKINLQIPDPKYPDVKIKRNSK